VTFTAILVMCRDFRLSPRFCVAAVKIRVLRAISAFERSLMIQESRAEVEKPHDAVVKLDTFWNLQRHHALLPAISRLLYYVRIYFQFNFVYFCYYYFLFKLFAFASTKHAG